MCRLGVIQLGKSNAHGNRLRITHSPDPSFMCCAGPWEKPDRGAVSFELYPSISCNMPVSSMPSLALPGTALHYLPYWPAPHLVLNITDTLRASIAQTVPCAVLTQPWPPGDPGSSSHTPSQAQSPLVIAGAAVSLCSGLAPGISVCLETQPMGLTCLKTFCLPWQGKNIFLPSRNTKDLLKGKFPKSLLARMLM